MNPPFDRARNLLSRRMVRDTTWSLIGEVGRLAGQVVVFVILTYVFDPAIYGVLVGVLAILWFLQPFAGVGATHLLLQRVAGDKWSLERAFGHGLTTTIAGGALVGTSIIALQPLVLPQIDRLTLGILAVSELIAVAIFELVLFSAIATENMRAMAVLRIVHSLMRTGAALGLLALTDEPDLWMWAVAAATTAAGVTALGIPLVSRELPRPRALTRDDIASGLPLSFGFGVAMIRGSADSYMLVRLDRAFDAGIYGAANRIVGMTRLPSRALLHSALARLYDAGARSIREGRELALRLTAASTLITAAGAMVILLGADVLVRVLPAEYGETAKALRWLSLLPVVGSVSVFAGTVLTAARLHGYRVAWIVLSAVVNVGLNILWIPDHGWEGATVASFISAGLYSAGVWATLMHFSRAEASGDYTVAAPAAGDQQNAR